MKLWVAPREITDYVERAARVGGCSPSDAHLLAEATTRAEVHGGGGVAEFVSAPDVVALAAAARSLDPVDSSPEHRQEYRRALVRGVEIDRKSWDRLMAIAGDFLVAESVLDALVD